jgi:hypothetical protein
MAIMRANDASSPSEPTDPSAGRSIPRGTDEHAGDEPGADASGEDRGQRASPPRETSHEGAESPSPDSGDRTTKDAPPNRGG